MKQPNTPPPAPSSFVTVMACLSIAMGVLGVVSGLTQGVVLLSVDPAALLRPQLEALGITLPPQLVWLFNHLGLLNLLSLLSSGVVSVVSWGLLKRHEWGRRGFIACLALGAVLGCFFAAWFAQAMAWITGLAGTDPAATDPMLQAMQSTMTATMVVSAALIAAVHAGIIWKLCAPAIRAEFQR
ncbi:MAG: hypothetical protein ABIO17_08045 [Pseudoxanthomonas sp.]